MKIKAGIIGLGVGEAHIEGYNGHPDCEVVSLCDFSEDKLASARRRYPGIKVTADADEILEDRDIDVVSIASYDNYHYSQIVKAIDNNKHIFVEKPISLYEEEAIGIRASLNKKPYLKLSSNLILRKSPRFMLLKEMIEEGRMGQIYYAEGDYNYGRLEKITNGWRGRLDFYSVVYGGGVHIVDLLLWLTGDEVTEVAAYGNDISTRGSSFRYNDMVVSILKFKSGMVGKVSCNFGCVSGHFHPLSIYGTKATFVNGQEYGSLFTKRDASLGFKKITAPYPGVHKGGLISNFVDSIVNDSKCEVSKDEIFNAISVCYAIEKSSRQSSPVTVKYI